MYQVKTPEGMKYMVMLVGPASYRLGATMHVYRGQTLTVSRELRDYLVRKTSGAFIDFDPAPAEEVDEILPPQFGDPKNHGVDLAELDPVRNPPLSRDQAIALASHEGTEVPVHSEDQSGEAGDMTAADLKPGQKTHEGAAPAANPKPKAGVTIKAKSAPVKTVAVPEDVEEVS